MIVNGGCGGAMRKYGGGLENCKDPLGISIFSFAPNTLSIIVSVYVEGKFFGGKFIQLC